MKAMRRNVIIDTGDVINQLGADLIETPQKYKRINNIGTIVSVGPECILLDESCVGKRCIMEVEHHCDNRWNPIMCMRAGLNKSWHFNVTEDKISAILD